ncbi:hypothetical protein V6N13_140767 [Hibiscus sabdariffa]|uniref:Trichome birefringence-like C-terminal domain-containing protein n=1 Tax=Hibiscus sabdariffa TaxID=183260 RepID=A0ABR2Q1Z0_9ROSI
MGSFANGEEDYSELDTPVAYQISLKTWANWIDSTINSNKTRVFFTTMSPIHTRSEDWGKNDGQKCFNETKPKWFGQDDDEPGGGRLLNDEEKADPRRHADCIHWCLPGVPDTWNQLLLALL